MTATNPLNRPPDCERDGEQSTALHGTQSFLAAFLDTHLGTRQTLQRRLQEYPEYRAWLSMFAGELLTTLEG